VQAISAREQPPSPPATDDIARDLYALVVHLHKNCTGDLFQAIGELDLTMTQTKLLGKLEQVEGELSLNDAALMLAISLPAVSRAVDELVRREMVARHEDHDDRRMKRIRLTETGATVIRRVNAARLSGMRQFTASLTAEERADLRTALELLLARPDVAACRPQAGDLT
jgi:DNA-binding MarR family transcriptional regulator